MYGSEYPHRKNAGGSLKVDEHLPASEHAKRAAKGAKPSLLALGSAAVLAVYAAGFVRTRPAAQRFEGADAERRPVHPAVPNADQSVGVVKIVEPTAAPPKKHVAKIPPKPKPVEINVNDVEEIVAAPPPPPPVTVAEPPVVVVATVPVTPPPAVLDSVPVAAADSGASVNRGKFKDGTYTGWGTSRHGDIEAAVDIRDGHIVSAYITQCLTRYSCSWISRLPPQVVDRQTPDVDNISGATQSSDAFYWAIFGALTKAK